MIAVAGILGQELLGVTPSWYEAGGKEYDIPAAPLTAIEFIIMGFLEIKRYQGFKTTGTVRAERGLGKRYNDLSCPGMVCAFRSQDAFDLTISILRLLQT